MQLCMHEVITFAVAIFAEVVCIGECAFVVTFDACETGSEAVEMACILQLRGRLSGGTLIARFRRRQCASRVGFGRWV
jgi:hypothetical protein